LKYFKISYHLPARLPRPPGYWRDIENQKDFIEDAAQKLHIKEVRIPEEIVSVYIQ
jgi:hypothetical protein